MPPPASKLPVSQAWGCPSAPTCSDPIQNPCVHTAVICGRLFIVHSPCLADIPPLLSSLVLSLSSYFHPLLLTRAIRPFGSELLSRRAAVPSSSPSPPCHPPSATRSAKLRSGRPSSHRLGNCPERLQTCYRDSPSNQPHGFSDLGPSSRRATSLRPGVGVAREIENNRSMEFSRLHSMNAEPTVPAPTQEGGGVQLAAGGGRIANVGFSSYATMLLLPNSRG